MNTSERGRTFIERQEGCVLQVYRDQLGKATIGIGHLLRRGDPVSLTEEQALAMLAADLRPCEAAVNSLVTVPLSQGQFDALVDLCFNCGTAVLHGTRCLAKLNAGDYDGARQELLGFVHGVNGNGVRVELPVLVARRQAAATELWDAVSGSP